MTTAEAGRRGGQARKRRLGPAGYASLGRLGGARVRQLVAAGRRAEQERILQGAPAPAPRVHETGFPVHREESGANPR